MFRYQWLAFWRRTRGNGWILVLATLAGYAVAWGITMIVAVPMIQNAVGKNASPGDFTLTYPTRPLLFVGLIITSAFALCGLLQGLALDRLMLISSNPRGPSGNELDAAIGGGETIARGV